MTTSYLPYDLQQQSLLPHALQDWLPECHPAYFICETVDARHTVTDQETFSIAVYLLLSPQLDTDMESCPVLARRDWCGKIATKLIDTA